MSEQLTDVVPLCRAVRRDDLPGVHCPHCASPVDDDLPTVVLTLPVPALLTDGEVLAGEL
ncbi:MULTISPECIES: hypothetical protein [unclassified Pseudonocardia]|uniref:hypothetical protein n=1 Tax=unclassified Pseudonocardia TaxID=2619320 RepID=UPI00094AFEE0|nr:hypothetical protein [Pseudonocardia sp. Ae707_Ps1]OLM19632.1 hypothetical protein Ae707Ps1_3891 [Pseudonocardia sp. Ae707_Ps1]